MARPRRGQALLLAACCTLAGSSRVANRHPADALQPALGRVEAALGPDGLPHITLAPLGVSGAGLAQAAAVAEASRASQLVHGSGPSREAEAAALAQAAAAKAEAESARLRRENEALRRTQELLRQEASMLRREGDELREESATLRRDDAELRREDAALRSQDTQLRRGGLRSALPALSATAFRSGHASKRVVLLSIFGGIAGLVVLGCLVSCSDCFQADDDGDEEEDDDALQKHEARLREALGMRGSKERSCCPRCCSPATLVCMTFFLIVSSVGGYVMWELGLLQPIIAQLSMYVYGIIMLGALVVLVFLELWWTLKSFFSFFLLQMNRMKSNVKGTVSKTAYSIRDFLDDGRLNRSVHTGN